MSKKRLAETLVLAAVVVAAALMPAAQSASDSAERFTNGSFEEGFASTPAGMVGNGWQWFHSGGGAGYGFYQDTWAPVVQDATSSQLIAITTVGYSGLEAPHYAGIYQTVAVVPGATYQLSLCGILRAFEDDPDRNNYSYRVQYGVDYGGGKSWQAVTNWVEIPWDTVYPRLSPGPMSSYSASLVASGPTMTVFFRVWYKWATSNRELDVNLDAISLKGPMPGGKGKSGTSYAIIKGSGASRVILEASRAAKGPSGVSVAFAAPQFPVAGEGYTIQVNAAGDLGVARIELYDNAAVVGRAAHEVGPLEFSHDFRWEPKAAGRHVLEAVAYDAVGAQAASRAEVHVGRSKQFVANGSFEQGFRSDPLGSVGTGWSAFDTGGRARYGFYDDTWAPVVHAGQHSQLIEINTVGESTSDPDRYAGICQRLTGLTPGATYRLSLAGMIRALDTDDDVDNFSYRVQWALSAGNGADWSPSEGWTELPWDTVYGRLHPGQMQHYTTQVVAGSKDATLCLRVWKKWGTVGREIDVNLDSIELAGYAR